MEESLIHRSVAAGMPYVLLVEDLDEAIGLHDRGYRVMVGRLDDPETYRSARAEQAEMLLMARKDTVNTNIAFTMREVTDAGIVVATVDSPDSIDVLHLAGCDHVFHLGRLLGTALARRILAPRARSRAISRFEDLVIAEAAATDTGLVGHRLSDLDLRQTTGVSVVAIWERGELRMTAPGLEITEQTVLVLAGTDEQLEAYDQRVDQVREAVAPTEPAPAGGDTPADAPSTSPSGDQEADDEAHVVIIGGGRVGRAVAHELHESATPAVIVERLPERQRPGYDYVEGDAADIDVLRRAGIERATAVVVTTHEDDMNVYLTLYCRRLRPDIEIVGRVNVERNVSTMHRAGADFVLSYASAGATAVWNLLPHGKTVLLAEGLVVFRVPMPSSLAGRCLADLDIPAQTGARVIGLARDDGETTTRVDPHASLPAGGHLLLIGDEESEGRFTQRHVTGDDRSWLRRWRSNEAGATVGR